MKPVDLFSVIYFAFYLFYSSSSCPAFKNDAHMKKPYSSVRELEILLNETYPKAHPFFLRGKKKVGWLLLK